jgi:hypothetical protein
MEPYTLDDFSVTFSDDLEQNMEYFKHHGWRPRMYNELYNEGRIIHGTMKDNVGETGPDPQATKLIANCEISELSESVREKLVWMLNVQEDEEVVSEGKAMWKVKKGEDYPGKP